MKHYYKCEECDHYDKDPEADWTDNDLECCPECGSAHVTISKYRTTVQGHKKIQFHCQETVCGKYHTVAASRFNNGAHI